MPLVPLSALIGQQQAGESPKGGKLTSVPDEPSISPSNPTTVQLKMSRNSQTKHLWVSGNLKQLLKGHQIELELGPHTALLMVEDVVETDRVTSVKAANDEERIRLTFDEETIVGTAGLKIGVYELRGNRKVLSYQRASDLMQPKFGADYQLAPQLTERKYEPKKLPREAPDA